MNIRTKTRVAPPSVVMTNFTIAAADAAAALARLETAAEDLEDVAAAQAGLAGLAAGEEMFPEEVVGKLIDGKNPVRVFRLYRGFSQAELGRRAGVRQGTISDIEEGDIGMSRVGTIERLARALSVGIEDLLPRPEE